MIFPSVNIELLLEIAGLSIATVEIAQGCPSGLYGVAQHRPD
jgi:hypothetical protein